MYRTIGLAALTALLWAAPAHAFEVSNNSDTGPGSLRQAIQDANSTAGFDTISFGDLGSNNKITPDTPLPTITEGVLIDGYSHPGASQNTLAVGNNAVLKVELSGEDLQEGAAPNGLTITSGAAAVRGLAINRFEGAAIRLETGGGNVVEGNFIGTDITGTLDLTSGAASTSDGVAVEDSDGNVVGGNSAGARNVISGNGNDGVAIRGAGSAGNSVLGNYIGTTKSGAVALGNAARGIFVQNAGTTTIGGLTAAARNLISGNLGDGARLADASDSDVLGNRIGTNAAGTAALGNGTAGVEIAGGAGNAVGFRLAGARNVISGNGREGVIVSQSPTDGASPTGTVVEGNHIGLDAGGTPLWATFAPACC